MIWQFDFLASTFKHHKNTVYFLWVHMPVRDALKTIIKGLEGHPVSDDEWLALAGMGRGNSMTGSLQLTASALPVLTWRDHLISLDFSILVSLKGE